VPSSRWIVGVTRTPLNSARCSRDKLLALLAWAKRLQYHELEWIFARMMAESQFVYVARGQYREYPIGVPRWPIPPY
jgi:hypothetical protein